MERPASGRIWCALSRVGMFLCVTAMCLSVCSASFASEGEPGEYMESVPRGKNGLTYKLAVRRWSTSKKPAHATVILQHGGGFHGGYFGQLAASLNDAGYEVVAPDLLGHGYSDIPVGLGWFDDIELVLKDLSKLAAQEKAREGGHVVLMGESMGALYVTPLAMRKDPSISGIILCGGLVKLAKETAPPGIVIMILKLVGRFFPKIKMPMPDLERTFDSAFGDARWPASIRKDPKVVRDNAYAGPAAQNLAMMQKIAEGGRELAVPILAMHSSIDTRTDFGAIKALVEGCASTDKTLKVYDDASHQLFQDSAQNIDRHIRDMLEWLDARFSTGSDLSKTASSPTSSPQESGKSSGAAGGEL